MKGLFLSESYAVSMFKCCRGGGFVTLGTKVSIMVLINSGKPLWSYLVCVLLCSCFAQMICGCVVIAKPFAASEYYTDKHAEFGSFLLWGEVSVLLMFPGTVQQSALVTSKD